MHKDKALREQFDGSRARLKGIAYRMLGSASEAEDAVQEAWFRLVRGDGGVKNRVAWLTTVVARICLDMLRARKSRREEPIGAETEALSAAGDSEWESQMTDSVGVAMLVVLETLPPAERVAFVLHDMFDLSFNDIAPVVGRSSAAARQLASRGRRRVQGAPAIPDTDRVKQREVVDAFLAASRQGDFSALLAVLDPDVALRADAVAVEASVARASLGAPPLRAEVVGRDAVAGVFGGRAGAARPAMVDGVPGLVFAPGGRPFSVFDFIVENGRIVEICLVADARSIAAMELEF
jgi:RNA polymerase sigma-70 factor (ECF subfamily)